MGSLSVDPGIEGVRLRVGRRKTSPAAHAARAAQYRQWISQQYTNSTPSHPYPLERALIQVFAERGCIRHRG